MRRFALLVVALFALLASAFGQAPSRIRVGDELTVYVYGSKDLSGPYTVQTDGAVYLPRVGRIVVSGLTASQAQARLLVGLKKFLLDPTATVSLSRQRGNSVYVVGGKESVIPISGETDLRQVYAAAQIEGDPDLLQISVFRNGRQIAAMSASDLTSGKRGLFTGPLSANDTVVIAPKPYIRVYVTGTVTKAGQVRLNEGDDVYRAIAAAGEITPPPAGETEYQRSDYVITVRRGDEDIRVPAVPRPNQPALRLQSGDTVNVRPPMLVRVTFTGLARNPGEKRYREGTTLGTAVGAEGGAAPATTTNGIEEPAGSLRNVILFHNGEASFHDLSPTANGGKTVASPLLNDGDVVYIPRNDRRLYVLGNVTKPGTVTMQDNRTYRLADAVAAGGGTSENGTLTRVTLARPGPDGKLVAKTYRLDKFVKSGDESVNPVLRPDDVVYVDSTRRVESQTVISAISAALLLNNLRL